MYCDNCGQPVLEGARFCAGCGAPAQVTLPASVFCASCGASIPQGGPFCPACGRPSLSAAIHGAVPMPSAKAEYGGFWRRFGARFLDGLIIAVLALIPAIIVGVMVYNAAYPGDHFFATDQQRVNAIVAGYRAGWAVYALFAVVYQVIGWSSGGTWGMRALGLRLVSLETDGRPGFGSAIIRLIVSYVSSIPLYLGFLWMIWDDKKQTWHDKAAGTVVVREP